MSDHGDEVEVVGWAGDEDAAGNEAFTSGAHKPDAVCAAEPHSIGDHAGPWRCENCGARFTVTVTSHQS